MPVDGKDSGKGSTGSMQSKEYLKNILNEAAKRGVFSVERGEESRGVAEDCVVEDVVVEAKGTLGENYGSSMCFADVRVRTPEGIKNVPIVIKALKKTPWHVEIMNIFALFKKEVEFFNRALPAILQFQRERGVRHLLSEYVPKCVFAKADGEEGILITENMCQQGYQMAERIRGLGLRHSTLSLQALGRFHAASLSMKILHPEAFWEASKEASAEAYFTEDRKTIFDQIYQQLSRGKILTLVNAEVERGAKDAALIKRAAIVAEEIMRQRSQLTIDEVNRYREPLAVFNHGDFWVNNVMFRYETSEQGKLVPVSAKILDFQMSRYGSPSLDLHTFLYTSISRQVRMDHEDELLRAYHRALLDGICEAGLNPTSDFDSNDEGAVNNGNEKHEKCENMEPPDGHPLSFSALKDDLRSHGAWALMISEMMLRVVMVDSSEASDVMEVTMVSGNTPDVDDDDLMIGYDMLKKLTTADYDARYFEVFRELAHKGYLADPNLKS